MFQRRAADRGQGHGDRRRAAVRARAREGRATPWIARRRRPRAARHPRAWGRPGRPQRCRCHAGTRRPVGSSGVPEARCRPRRPAGRNRCPGPLRRGPVNRTGTPALAGMRRRDAGRCRRGASPLRERLPRGTSYRTVTRRHNREAIRDGRGSGGRGGAGPGWRHRTCSAGVVRRAMRAESSHSRSRGASRGRGVRRAGLTPSRCI